MNFKGKTVIVTGGGSGIGKAIAIKFAELKANVIIVGRNEERLRNTADLDSGIAFVQADLLDLNSYSKVINSTIEQFGSLDILVNNAGILKPMFIENVDLEDFSELFQVNIYAPALLVKEALIYLKQTEGQVMNIGSSLGHIPDVGQIGYGTSKAALEQLTKNMAVELAEYGIRVNCVAPGPTDTEILAMAGFSEEMIAQSNSDMKEQLPLGRRGHPDEIAEMVIKMCDPSVSWITGQVLSVDEAMSIA